MKLDQALSPCASETKDTSHSSGSQITQPKKLYIKIKMRTMNLAQLEKKFCRYFADFGEVEDIKVLQNSWIKRANEAVRIRFFQGGDNFD